MSNETKEQLVEQRDALTAELEETRAALAEERNRNQQLQGSLVALKPTGEHQAVVRQPYLSEAERAELELRGRTTSPFTGREVTRDEALAALAKSEDQSGVEIGEPSAELAAAAVRPAKRAAVEGVDYVWPSVAPGVLADEARVDAAGNAQLPGNVVG